MQNLSSMTLMISILGICIIALGYPLVGLAVIFGQVVGLGIWALKLKHDDSIQAKRYDVLIKNEYPDLYQQVHGAPDPFDHRPAWVKRTQRQMARYDQFHDWRNAR